MNHSEGIRYRGMTLFRWVSLLAVLLVVLFFVAGNVRVTYAAPRWGSRGEVGPAEFSGTPRTTGYDLSWYTVDGASATNLSGGSFTLSGTIGQYEAGSESGGNFLDIGGFWLRADFFGYPIYLPLTLR